ncbi:MAG: hypothetical protein DSM106950_31145 [Stigonema ocellatum SAG 48.90 = DSM 106950]|nr:hypothetical protein [Stigonema ocellatum SAG 48.90 = DSM 106950]
MPPLLKFFYLLLKARSLVILRFDAANRDPIKFQEGNRGDRFNYELWNRRCKRPLGGVIK